MCLLRFLALLASPSPIAVQASSPDLSCRVSGASAAQSSVSLLSGSEAAGISHLGGPAFGLSVLVHLSANPLHALLVQTSGATAQLAQIPFSEFRQVTVLLFAVTNKSHQLSPA